MLLYFAVLPREPVEVIVLHVYNMLYSLEKLKNELDSVEGNTVEVLPFIRMVSFEWSHFK